jgi:hypothetical protein
MGFFLGTGGAMSWRMASKTALNWESYFRSKVSTDHDRTVRLIGARLKFYGPAMR